MAQDPQDPSTVVNPGDIKPTAKQGALGVLGAVASGGQGQPFQGSPIDQAIEKQNQTRLNEARMHRANIATYTGILHTGKDVSGHMPDGTIDPTHIGKPLTPGQEAMYRDWLNAAQAAYEKAVGKGKDSKGLLERGKMLVEHLVGKGRQQPEGGLTPPPSANATPAAPQGGAPQSGMAAPPKYEPMAGAATRQDVADTHDIEMKKRQGQAAFDQRKEFAKQLFGPDAENQLGVKEYVATGKFPLQAHLQKAVYKDPKDKQVKDGSFDPSSGQYLDQKGNPVDGALPASLAEMQPKQFKYMKDGKLLPGFQVGKVYQDMEGNPLPPGTELYQRGLLGTDTFRQILTYDPTTGEPQINTLETVRKPITDTGGGGGSSKPSGGGMSAPPKLSTPQAGKDATGKPLGSSSGMFNQQVNRAIPVREAITQVLGDPTQPNLQALKDFSHLADSPESQKRLGTALKLTFDNLESQQKAHGSLVTLAQAYLEVPQALATAKAGIMQDVISKMTPEEQAAYDKTITAASALVGLRSLTRGGAAKFSVEALERDLPLIGINATNAKEFQRKLAGIAELAYNGSRNISDSVMPKEEKEYIKKQVDELSKAGTTRGGLDKPPSTNAPSAGVLSEAAKAYLKSHGVTVP